MKMPRPAANRQRSKCSSVLGEGERREVRGAPCDVDECKRRRARIREIKDAEVL